MENISLKQAISAIYDMELNNYLMTRAVKSLDGALHKNLPHPEDDFDMPKKPTQPKKHLQKILALFLQSFLLRL